MAEKSVEVITLESNTFVSIKTSSIVGLLNLWSNLKFDNFVTETKLKAVQKNIYYYIIQKYDKI